MPLKRHDDAFLKIASFPALHAAAKRAIKGKRRKPTPAAFMAGLEREILKLERELQWGTYRPGGYVTIRVEDPKSRIVSAAPFRDRVVHHALCAVIEPIFECGFIFDRQPIGQGYARGRHPLRALSRSLSLCSPRGHLPLLPSD